MTLVLSRLQRPTSGEYDPYFETYIRLVPAGDLSGLFTSQQSEQVALYGSISEAEASTVHPPYQWTIKQVLGHVIDGERVFGYRAARIASGDQTPLPSFDENAMVAGMNYHQVALEALISEWSHLRAANRSLFNRLDDDQWARQGIVSGRSASVRALGWILVGHAEHHARIVRKRLGRE